MRIAIAATLLLACADAGAQNWVSTLKNGPAERFDEQDLRMFLDAGRKVLNEAADNETVKWQNPDTKHGGELTVVRRFEWQKKPCKEVRIRNEADGRKADSTVNACQVDGKWRLLSSQQLKKK